MAGQVRVDQITDEAGTGSPDFINGITVQGTPFTSSTLGGNYVQRTYTSPATWTKPAGLKAVKVTVVGGGGGGNGGRGNSQFDSPRTGGHGGGGGAAVRYIPAPSIPGPVAVTHGAGGAGGPAPATVGTITAGSAGGTSSFGSFLSATGGSGAAGVPAPTGTGVPGAGGIGSTGDFNISGGTSPVPAGGVGRNNCFAGSLLSTGAVLFSSGNGDGQIGAAVGGGGTGCLSSLPTFASHAGGTGAAGIVIVEEFY
jgi:hypothetical protein